MGAIVALIAIGFCAAIVLQLKSRKPMSNNSVNEIVARFEIRATELLKSMPAWEAFFERIDEEADIAVGGILATVASTDVKQVHDRVKDLINMGAGGQSPLIDEPLVRTCQTLLQFTIAALTLALVFSQRIAAFPPIFSRTVICFAVFLAGLLLTALAVLTMHAVQGRFRFPFLYLRRIGNPWNWFYYGCISPNTPRNPLQPGSTRKNRGAAFYATDFVKFTKSTVSGSEADALRDDLQHLFLVMSYQGYVHQFSLQISKAFVYGVAGSVVGLLVSLILVWLKLL